MTRRSWTLVEFGENLLTDHSSNIDVVLFEEKEVRVALDANVGELDPLVVGKAHLLVILNKAVVVRDMRASLAGDHDVRHLAELCKLVDCTSL